MFWSNQSCFTSKPEDSIFFGLSVAINERYLAVGDPAANRVVIYTRNSLRQWVITKKVSPPKGSIPYQKNRGFGRNLQLEGSTLIVESLTQELIPNTAYTNNYYGRYLVTLESKTEAKPINLAVERETGFVQFNLLSKGAIEKIVVSNIEEESKFGCCVALRDNLLLVGSPSYYVKSGGWLFDLDRPDNKPLKLTAPNAYIGETIALSSHFAAVGNLGEWFYPPEDAPRLQKKTLIRSIKNGSTKVIDSYGELSLSRNILAIMRPQSDDDEQKALLEVFRLDEDATPRLIKKRKHLIRAWVQNGFLITVSKKFSRVKLCIEPAS